MLDTCFAELKASHNDIHKYATQSWQAKEDGNVELAMEYFNKAHDAFYVYHYVKLLILQIQYIL